jgi:hypothetical protein
VDTSPGLLDHSHPTEWNAAIHAPSVPAILQARWRSIERDEFDPPGARGRNTARESRTRHWPAYAAGPRLQSRKIVALFPSGAARPRFSFTQ